MIMKSFAEQLQNNPIFQLSLSSKELFHSNFLAWLAEDKNTRRLFNRLMQDWLNDPDWEFDDEKMMVKREYKNFDFCICEKYSIKGAYVTGCVKMVLENKFKSIAYEAQLSKYKERTDTLNEEGCKNKYKAEKELQGEPNAKLPKNWREEVKPASTKHILLTLAEDFLEKKEIEKSGWTVIAYASYAKTLRENIELITDNFYRQIIERYCDFIDIFSSEVNCCLNKIQMGESWDILHNKQFREVRCHDVWQKLVMHKCALEIKYMLEKEGLNVTVASSDKDILKEQNSDAKNNIFILVGYYHSEGMLELKYILPGKSLFTLQQQGVHPLRTGILDNTKTRSKHPKDKKHMSAWNEYVEGFINNTCKLGDMIRPKVVNKETDALYNSYGNFYYNDLNDNTKPIGDTLQDMVDKIKEVRDRKLKGE